MKAVQLELWTQLIILTGDFKLDTTSNIKLIKLSTMLRRDKIVLELLSTEKSYIEDLKIVISGYKQKVIKWAISKYFTTVAISRWHPPRLLPRLL